MTEEANEVEEVGILLSSIEIEGLTGYRRAAEQKSWLMREGFKYRVGGDGKVKLARDHFNEVMCGKREIRKKRQPNFELVNNGS